MLNGEDNVIELITENVANDIKESLEFLIKENKDIRDAEVELQMAQDPNLVGFSKEPMTRSFAIEEEEKDPILASSSLPLQRPSGIN